MFKIHPEPLEATKELFVEDFYSIVRGNKSEEERKLEETDDVHNLEDSLKLLAGFLKTKYCQLLQLRSDTLRGVLDNFISRLTFFMHKTGLYADARMRKSYLMFYHLGYNMAAHISQSNRQTSKLWNLPKSVLLNIRRANFNFQLDLAKDNLKDYLPINNYCHYSKWVNPDDVELPEEIVKNYNFDNYKPNPDRFFWVFSREMCDYLFNRIITRYFRQAILFLQHFESATMFNEAKELIEGSWLCCAPEDMVQFLMWTLINILKQGQLHEEHYNKLALYVDIILDLCLVGFVLPNEESVFNLLTIGRLMMEHGTYSKCFPLYYKIIKRILGWTNLQPKLNIDHLFKMVEDMDKKTDFDTSLIDLLEFTSRVLVFYRSWDVEFRARLVKYIITHCNSKDINKRIVYMSISAFLNRTLRRTDYAVKELAVNHGKFVNQNGYVDMFMLKETFREIRANIHYSSDPTQIFTAEQNEELDCITEDCIPSVVFAQYLTLPFKALVPDGWCDSTTASYFAEKFTSLEQLELYTSTVTDFIQQLIYEYNEDLDAENLYVGYDFAELLIDTKKQYKFDKDLLIFASFKVFCLFLGLSACKIVAAKIQDARFRPIDTQASFNKVFLKFYSGLVGASGYFDEAQFREVLKMGKPILKPFFSAFSTKFLESFMDHLNLALRGNLSYRRLRMFFNMILELMQEDTKENHVYYLNLFIFQIRISQMILPDEFLDMFKKVMEECDLAASLSSVNVVSRVVRALNGVRLLLSFTDEFIARNNRLVIEDTLSVYFYNRDVINFEEYIQRFLRNLKDNSVVSPWMKLEGIKHIVYMVYDKKITSHNLSIVKKLFYILFNLQVKDFSDLTLVVAYRDLILDMRNNTIVQRHIKDMLLILLMVCWKRAKAFECYKGILMIYSIGYAGRITETVHEFLTMVTKVNKLGMQDDIFLFVRDDIFSRLSDDQLFSYTSKLADEVAGFVAQM